MIITRVALLSLAAVTGFGAELPAFYKSVARVTWVVDDLDKTIAGWKKAGVQFTSEGEVMEFRENRFRGKESPFRVRLATGVFENVLVDWMQPAGGESAYSDFLKQNGPGVYSLMYGVPSSQAYDAERKRLMGLGVGIEQEGVLDFSGARIHYAYFDTRREGKYALGLILMSDDEPLPDVRGPRVTQFAFVARKLEPVSDFWAKLGLPALTYTHPDMSDTVYRGKPAQFAMRLGWQRHGSVPFEWIEPLKGPTVYEDHLARHGEGFHHLAFNVPDIDEASRRWESLGFPLSMGGAWGEKGKPGSGRFAYHDTHSIGGADIELLWSFKP